MKITASALSLNVADVTASANFVKQYFGFSEEMSAEDFVSLSRPDAGFNLIFLKTGLLTFKPIHMRGHRADGLLVTFVVDDIVREASATTVQIVKPLPVFSSERMMSSIELCSRFAIESVGLASFRPFLNILIFSRHKCSIGT